MEAGEGDRSPSKLSRGASKAHITHDSSNSFHHIHELERLEQRMKDLCEKMEARYITMQHELTEMLGNVLEGYQKKFMSLETLYIHKLNNLPGGHALDKSHPNLEYKTQSPRPLQEAVEARKKKDDVGLFGCLFAFEAVRNEASPRVERTLHRLDQRSTSKGSDAVGRLDTREDSRPPQTVGDTNQGGGVPEETWRIMEERVDALEKGQLSLLASSHILLEARNMSAAQHQNNTPCKDLVF